MSINLESIPNIGESPLDHVLNNGLASHGEDELWIEFGVWKGATINRMAEATKGIIYGFDSFQGLPEDWRTGYEAGTFNEEGKMPIVKDNVQLIKGWFDDTLPQFLKKHASKKASLLHIDCDIYSSTAFVLFSMVSFLKQGTIIVFDELINYPGYDNDKGELRALQEFVDHFNVKFQWIGMNGSLGQFESVCEKVALRIDHVSI